MSDRDLARRMLAGDETAIRSFMDTYFPRLYRFAFVRLGMDAAAAEDVVQETVAIAARRIETYRGEATLMSWLVQICAREISRYRRRHGKHRQADPLDQDEALMMAVVETIGDEMSEPSRFAEKAELASLVHLLLDQLPDRYGDVLEWKYVDGLSIVEIGTRLELGAEAVQSLLARARRAFKASFREVEGMVT